MRLQRGRQTKHSRVTTLYSPVRWPFVAALIQLQSCPAAAAGYEESQTAGYFWIPPSPMIVIDWDYLLEESQ